MTISKKLVALSAFSVMSVATLSYVAVARADTNSDSLASKIAQKFNVSEDEVNQVIEEHHQEKHTEHQKEITSKLENLVADGKITVEQKDALIKKFDEMKTERENNKEEFKDMTREERRVKMDKKRSEMDKWLEQNGIDKTVIEGIMGSHGKGRGMHKGM